MYRIRLDVKTSVVSHVLKTIKPDGTLMILEPFANDKVISNSEEIIIESFDDKRCP